MTNALAQLVASAVAAAASVTIAAPASADPINAPSDPFTIHFEYNQAELTTEAGQQKLLQRMEGQVRRKCTPSSQRTPLPTPEVKKCIDITMRATLGKFNSDSLASLYTSRHAG